MVFHSRMYEQSVYFSSVFLYKGPLRCPFGIPCDLHEVQITHCVDTSEVWVSVYQHDK